MPKTGDHFSVTVKMSHLDWGRYRRTQSREPREGEAYVKLSLKDARRIGIRRGNLFTATFSDGHPSFTARAAGSSKKGGIYAKQFQGDGDLKAFGRWYSSNGAKVGDTVVATFTDPNTINFELIKQ